MDEQILRLMCQVLLTISVYADTPNRSRVRSHWTQVPKQRIEVTERVHQSDDLWGYIVHFDEEKFDKIYKFIVSISNNVNQIAVRVNSMNKAIKDVVNVPLNIAR